MKRFAYRVLWADGRAAAYFHLKADAQKFFNQKKREKFGEPVNIEWRIVPKGARIQ